MLLDADLAAGKQQQTYVDEDEINALFADMLIPEKELIAAVRSPRGSALMLADEACIKGTSESENNRHHECAINGGTDSR